MEWLIFKSSTTLPAAPSSGVGRARKTGRKNDGSVRARQNFWNGANGWLHKSRSIAPRDLTFRLTPESRLDRYEPRITRMSQISDNQMLDSGSECKMLIRMNWEMLAAIGQLAAVFVGIPSLIYLAVQIREQTKERRQSAVNALTVQWGDLTRALHESAEFTAIYLRGVHAFHDLDAVSKLRFSAFQNRFFKNFEGMYYSRCDGILTPELWGEIERTMSDFLAYDGVRQWWETRKHWHTEEFRHVVDAIIARGDKPKAYSTYNLREIVAPEARARINLACIHW